MPRRQIPRPTAGVSDTFPATPIFYSLYMRKAAQVDEKTDLMPPDEIEHSHDGSAFLTQYLPGVPSNRTMIASPNHSSRGGAKVRLLVVHTAEGARTVESLGSFFSREANQVSAHAGIDDKRTELYVPYDRAAWTARGANSISDQVELCGFAKWTRQQWLEDHPTMIGQLANWLKERAAARGIPLRKLSPGQVAAGESGVCAHVDWTVGMKDGTHTDCGTQFPWDVVMRLATGGPAPEVPIPGGMPKMDVLPWTLPAGEHMQETIPIPLFPPYSKEQRAELWMVTGWEDAHVDGMYFIRDKGPNLTPVQEQWGGTKAWTLVRDDRPGFDLTQGGLGCTSVAVLYSAPRPIHCLIRYTP